MINVTIPLALANKEILKPDRLMVYIWLNYFCEYEGEWEVDYKLLSKMSGLTVKQLSLIIKNLETLNLLEISRRAGKVTVGLAPVLPDNIQEAFALNWAETVLAQGLQNAAKQFSTDPDQILLTDG